MAEPAPWALKQVRSVAERENPGWSESDIERLAFSRQSGDLGLQPLRDLGVAERKQREASEATQRAFRRTSSNTATSIIKNLLEDYGLTFDSRQVQKWVGLYSDNPSNLVLIKQEIEDSPEYAQRFPGMQARIDNGYDPITPEEYIALESQYRTIIRNTGLPEQFYDTPEEMAELLANNVAPREFESRVVDGFLAAQEAPDEVKQALREFYGIGNTTGALAAYFLDPEKGEQAILREFESAQVAGAAQMTRAGAVSKRQAEDLAALGVDLQRALQGFGNIGAAGGAVRQNLGRGQTFTMDQLIGAEFENDATVQERIRRQREARRAEFEGSSTGGVTSRGVAGLADTNT